MSEPARPDAERLVGRTLGDFVVSEKIGEGGFGAVYRALQPLLQRAAVIKVLRAQHQSSESVIQRFLREATLASRLDHPYAAHIYAFGAEPDGLLWIAMELVRGTPLDQLLKKEGRLALPQLVPLLEHLCEVLHTAHEQGIVHRDIKPANVMVLARAGRLLPKLLDFGIAKLRDDAPETADSSTAGLPSKTPSGLTQRAGGIVGSPPYMAPEQWINSPEVGARSDLYALGALSFEALTGKPPFVGASLMQTAKAHAKQPVPPLGPGFPVELDAVLSKVLAKKPADRFASALEFAQAFRAAAGMANEPVALPRIEETLREALLAEAPQPLAEAVAALEAARNPHQASDALAQTVEALVRLLALYALAARSRSAEVDGDSDRTRELWRLLRRRVLTDEEWLELAGELTASAVAQPALHPMPELVELLHPPLREGSGERPPTAVELLTQLASTERQERDARGSDGERLSRLAHGVAALESVVRALGFLFDYPLGVVRGAAVERWMGVRRPRRAALVLRAPVGTITDGEVVLCNREGTPLLRLHPLLQVVAPSPGAPTELFLFAGQGRSGPHLSALPYGFEHGDEGLWSWFRAHLGGDGPEATTHDVQEQSPFRGLASFGADDAALFFGREREAEHALNRLRGQPLIAVVGPSGAGKSSFVHAGVVPGLPAGSQVISIRPGPAPLATLAARLARAGRDLPGGERSLRTELHDHPDALAEHLEQLSSDKAGEAGEGGAALTVLVIDQFEELFTLCTDDDERQRFVLAVVRAARSAENRVRLILTLRDDFLLRADELPPLKERLAQSLLLLATPQKSDLQRILIEPARRAGYEWEDAALVDEMVASVRGQAGALPLLSFTADQLWARRDRHFRQLGRQSYRALGGVGGALAQHAEAMLASLLPVEQRLVREAFRHLVTSEGTRAVVARPELLQLLGVGHSAPARAAVIERMIDARLLVASESVSEWGAREERIEVVHEALLSAWPRLVEWRREDAEGARLRDQLRAASRQWSERGRPRGLLWRGDALLELKVWRKRYGTALTDADRDFCDASLAEAARGRRIGVTLVSAALALLTVGLLAMAQLNRRARTAAAEAQARVAELYEDNGRKELLDDHPERAAVYLDAAFQRGRDTPALRYLMGRVQRELAPLQRTYQPASGKLVNAVHLDGALATLSDTGAVELWDPVADRARPLTLPTPATALTSDARDTLYIATSDGNVSSYAPITRVLTATRRLGPGTVTQLRASGEGSLLALMSDHSVWLSHGAGQPAVHVATRGEVHALMLSRDGNRLALADASGATLWDARSVTPRAQLVGAAGVNQFVLSPDGALFATASNQGRAQLWRSSDGGYVVDLAAHTAAINFIAFDRAGARTVTAGLDGTLQIADVHGPARATLLGSAQTPQRSARFSNDGQRLLSTDERGVATLWDVATRTRLAELHGHASFAGLAFFDGRHALTLSPAPRGDGTARWWSVEDVAGRAVSALDSAPAKVRFEASGLTVATDRRLTRYSPNLDRADTLLQFVSRTDGGCIDWRADLSMVALCREHDVRVWRPAEDHSVALLAADAYEVAFAPDAPILVTAGNDHRTLVWELPSGRLRAELPGSALVTAAQPTRDGRVVALATYDGHVAAWNVAPQSPRFDVRLSDSLSQQVTFDPSETHVLTANTDGTARVLSIADGHSETLFEGDHRWVTLAATFSSDGRLVATVDADHVVTLWEVASARALDRFRSDDGPRWESADVAFSADDTRLAAAGSQAEVPGAPNLINVWNVTARGDDAAAFSAWVRCRVPLALRNGQLITAPTDCGGLRN